MRQKIKYITVLAVGIILMFSSNIYAASNISASSTNVYVGDTITVNATVSSVASWGMYVSSSGPVSYVSGTINSANTTEDAKNGTNTITSTYIATSVGTITFALTGNTTDENGNRVDIENYATVYVTKKPEPEPTPQPPSNNNNNTYTPPKNNNNNNTSKKDSNTYLSYLELSEEGMTPSFVKTKTSYSITVGMDVNEISINADTESDSSYYYVEGNKDLVEGDNNIRVVVVAENGSTRTYNIIVTKTSDPIKADAYLENLIIEDIRFTPEFQSEVLEYDLGKIEFNIDKLNILTFTKNENAKVEIIGNENLKVGENEIKIIVTAEDGVTKKEYKLKVTKNEETIDEENALKNTERSSSQKFKDFMENIWLSVKANALLVLMYCFIVVEFIQIVYLYKQLNKKDEILEKYGIDENGEMTTTRSGRRRDLDIINESDYNKKLSSIDIPLEIEDKKDDDDKTLKFDEIKNDVDSDNKE